MAEPFLHLGNIGFMGEGIGGGRRPHGMHAQSVDLDVQAGGLPVFPHHVPIESIRIEGPFQLARAVVAHWPEQWAVLVVAVAGHHEIALDQPLRLRRHKMNLPALARHLEADHALTALQILYFQRAQLFPAHPLIEQRRENGPITHVL